MGYFPLFLLLILNSLQVFKLLIFFWIDFLLFYATRKKITNSAVINLTQWLLNHPLHNPQPLSQQMLASRTILLHPFCTHIFQTSLSSRPFIIQHLSPAQKLNCLLSNMVLVKIYQRKMSPRSLSSLTSSTLLKRSLTPYLIHSKVKLWLSQGIYINSS